MENTSHLTDAGRITWYARVWRQADRAAVDDKRSVPKQRAEYHARRQLREAVDAATSHASRTGVDISDAD